MSIKVVYLPGVMGSELMYRPSPRLPGLNVWLNPIAVVGDGLTRLDLAADGIGPGPLAGGMQLVPGGPLYEFYGLLEAALLAQGYNVLSVGYDWRKSMLRVAGDVWAVIKPWLGSDPLYIVAHSMGGVLARFVWGAMEADGQQAQLARMICIGTPHFGSFETFRTWWRQPQLYALLANVAGLGVPWSRNAAIAFIDQVVGSWPAFYELMPFKSVGPLATAYPDVARAIYTSSTYLFGNPTVDQAHLDAGAATQQSLQAFLPFDRMVNINGEGQLTAYTIGEFPELFQAPTYAYTDQGDGSVTLQQAALPGVTQYVVRQVHWLLPSDPTVQGIVKAILSGSSPALGQSAMPALAVRVGT